MSGPPAPSSSNVPNDASRWAAWWVGTWIVGVIAGSVVAGALFAPSRADDDPDLPPDPDLPLDLPVDMVSGGVGDVLGAPIGVIAASLVVLWAIYLTGMWIASRRLGSADPVADYGVRFRSVDLLGVPIGIAAQLGVVWLVYLPLKALWPDTFSDERLNDTAADLVERADGVLLIVLFALVVGGAPIVEELFFRGMLQRPLLSVAATGRHQVLVVVAVAAVFALIHFRPLEYPGLFAFGLILGACAWRTDRLAMAILAHVAFNATGLVSVL